MMQSFLILLAILFVYILFGWIILWALDLGSLRKPHRFFWAMVASITFIPVSMIAFSGFVSFVPGPAALLVLVGPILVVGFVLRRLGKRPTLALKRTYASAPPHFPEHLLAIGWILSFALLINLPRFDMLLRGAETVFVNPPDDHWHMAQLISMARTGLPPRHYYFPQIDLVYYFASWMLPAILGNIPLAGFSLARSMAIHTILQTAVFLGVCWYFLALNVRYKWARLAGLAFFTLAGGLDLLVHFGVPVEEWQSKVPWLVSQNVILQFADQYLYIPQHVAGAMAFVCGLILWRNGQATLALKVFLSAVLFAFAFLTSPFIAASSGLFVLIWAFLERRNVMAKWKSVWAVGLMGAGVIGLASWRALVLSSQHAAQIGWSVFRVPIFERLVGDTPANIVADRFLTAALSPLVMSIIYLIELGAPFILFIIWAFQRRWASRPAWEKAVLVYTGVYSLVVVLFQDFGGGGNLVTRGLMPVQIVIVLAAVDMLDQWADTLRSNRLRWTLGCALAAIILATSLSWLVELKAQSNAPISSLTGVRMGSLIRSGEFTLIWPEPLEYIHWFNANTPAEAVVIEDGCAGVNDDPRYRLLERSRWISAQCAAGLNLIERDRDFLLLADWRMMAQENDTAVDVADHYEDWFRGVVEDTPVYEVRWIGQTNASEAPSGEIVYEDGYVKVYKIR